MNDFDTYMAFSTGHGRWNSDRARLKIRTSLMSTDFNDIFKSEDILNFLGMDILSMPYTKKQDGKWSFDIPTLSNTISSDIITMDTIGEISTKLVSPIMESDNTFLNNNIEFILYNDKIEIIGSDIYDVDIVNILINVAAVFLVQTYRRAQI